MVQRLARGVFMLRHGFGDWFYRGRPMLVLIRCLKPCSAQPSLTEGMTMFPWFESGFLQLLTTASPLGGKSCIFGLVDARNWAVLLADWLEPPPASGRRWYSILLINLVNFAYDLSGAIE